MPTINASESRPCPIGLTLLLALALVSCGGGSGDTDPPIDENAFIQMALQASCADIRNKLYAIDDVLVLSNQAGNCADASYSQVLYGTSIKEVYCRNHDSIAGPVKRCDVAIYQDLFDIMIANLDKPDLGLGSTHSVKVLL
jgi:hypothetical protein